MTSQLYDDLTGRDGQCIRLIHLDGVDADSGRIHCHLETVVLQDAPRYWALSYCWGDASEPLLIACNSVEIPVTQNLHAALLRLSKLEPRPPLWIDAICINQQNPHEKAEQVRLMGRIYQCTQKVVVWLGPANEGGGSREKIEFAMDLCRKYHNIERASIGIRERFLMSTYAQPLPQDETKSRIDPKRLAEYIPERVAIANLLGRSWWQRVWIIQELSLARDVLVLCGDAMMEWDVFSRGIYNFLDLCDPYGTDFSPVHSHHVRALLDFRANARDNGDAQNKAIARYRLVTLLHRFRWSCATDPRDKVFGLLGLASAGPGQPSIDVRYTSNPSKLQDVVECYASVTYEIIKTNRQLDVLQLCGIPPALIATNSSLKGLPSWTPDFSLDASKLTDKFMDPKLLESPTLKARLSLAEVPPTQPPPPQASVFSAAGDSAVDELELLDHQSLRLMGFLWDTIEVVGIPYPDTAAALRVLTAENAKMDEIPDSVAGPRLGARLAVLWDMLVTSGSHMHDLLAWWKLARGLPGTYPDGQPLLDAFCAVVHQGCCETPLGLPAAQYAANFKRVLQLLRAVDSLLLWPLAVSARLRPARHAALITATGALVAAWPSMDLTHAANQRLVCTRRGYLALVPQQTRAGDRVALLRGGSVPFIVREHGGGCTRKDDGARRWELVGGCYVHGIMHGEQWDESLCHQMVFI